MAHRRPASRETRPPRLFRSILGAVLPPRMRAEQLADLDDEYRIRVEAGRAARGWYRWQVVRSVAPALACRLRDLRDSQAASGGLLLGLGDDAAHAARSLRRSRHSCTG